MDLWRPRNGEKLDCVQFKEGPRKVEGMKRNEVLIILVGWGEVAFERTSHLHLSCVMKKKCPFHSPNVVMSLLGFKKRSRAF